MLAENELKSVSSGVTTDGTEEPTTESMKTENLVYDEEKFKEISAHGGKEHEYKWERMSPEKLYEEQSAEMKNQHEQIAKNNETELQNLREQEAKGMLVESQSEVEQSGLIGASAW